MDEWLIPHLIFLLSLLVSVELDQGFSGKFGRGLDAATHRAIAELALACERRGNGQEVEAAL